VVAAAVGAGVGAAFAEPNATFLTAWRCRCGRPGIDTEGCGLADFDAADVRFGNGDDEFHFFQVLGNREKVGAVNEAATVWPTSMERASTMPSTGERMMAFSRSRSKAADFGLGTGDGGLGAFEVGLGAGDGGTRGFHGGARGSFAVAEFVEFLLAGKRGLAFRECGLRLADFGLGGKQAARLRSVC
jgi:hypothetical protein